jgi:hypothetical protein
MCDYLLGFQEPKKINDSVLKKKWPKNDLNVEDDPYETLILAYNKEMNQLAMAITTPKCVLVHFGFH